MPYIRPDTRREDGRNVPENAGELNYVVSREVSAYIGRVGVSYQTLHDVVGVLRDSATEIERRFVGPYEDLKRTENGDVFQEIVNAFTRV